MFRLSLAPTKAGTGVFTVELAGRDGSDRLSVSDVTAVHWSPAQSLFGIGGMSLDDGGLAASVASSVLILDEGRKLLARLIGWSRTRPAVAS